MYSFNHSNNQLKNLLVSTKLHITEEKDIKPHYTANINNLSEIEYILQTNDICLCIHNKLISRLSNTNTYTNNINTFNSFVECITNIEHHIKPIIIIGLYLTKNKINETTKAYLDNENNNYNNGISRIRYYNLYEKDEDKLLLKIQAFLHKIKFYMYENDGNCIMGNL